jgi:NAD(P)-dependent dehydrogenase (short-subunit alcohol dehydrogenase family)
VKEIKSAGGSTQAAEVDALDERAVEKHLDDGVSMAGSLDVPFNLITRDDVQGIPLVEMTTDDLLRAVTNGLGSNFITARAAARQMIKQHSGVILHLNSASGDALQPGMGSTGPADAATEALMRHLSAELGPRGVRVLRIWTAGVAETLTSETLASMSANVPPIEHVRQALAGTAALRRNTTLAGVAEVAAFLASERAPA